MAILFEAFLSREFSSFLMDVKRIYFQTWLKIIIHTEIWNNICQMQEKFFNWLTDKNIIGFLNIQTNRSPIIDIYFSG